MGAPQTTVIGLRGSVAKVKSPVREVVRRQRWRQLQLIAAIDTGGLGKVRAGVRRDRIMVNGLERGLERELRG